MPLAVCASAEGTSLVVGFAMCALDRDDGNYWIYRLMIGADYQGRGYGREALAALIQMLSRFPGCDRILLGVAREDRTAIVLYESVGFRPTGDVIDGEIVLVLWLSPGEGEIADCGTDGEGGCATEG